MFISLLQHEPGSTTGNCESTTASRSRLTGASTADAIIKDEPDFVETHCHWVGCDRDLHSQDQLVKVCTSRPNSPYNLQLFESSKIDI